MFYSQAIVQCEDVRFEGLSMPLAHQALAQTEHDKHSTSITLHERERERETRGRPPVDVAVTLHAHTSNFHSFHLSPRPEKDLPPGFRDYWIEDILHLDMYMLIFSM